MPPLAVVRRPDRIALFNAAEGLENLICAASVLSLLMSVVLKWALSL